MKKIFKKIVFYLISFDFFRSLLINLLKKISFQSERFLNVFSKSNDLELNNEINITKIKKLTENYIQSLSVKEKNQFVGYKHSQSCKKINLYSLISVLLIKHIFNIDQNISEELEVLKKYQCEDGLFRDKNINCKEANFSDDWGWKHLTLHALMTLDLYSIKSNYPIKIGLELTTNNINEKLSSYDWNKKLPWTSNAVQNLCVYLQYNRKYFNQSNASDVLKKIEFFINTKQSKHTGLFSDKFDTFEDLSNSVQSAYHFWLIYFSEGYEINYKERIIDNVLKTQNLAGGFGYKLNSSACEDIDSIDILLRLSKQTDYRKNDIKESLNKSVSAILNNLNKDGGWVFRRNESLKIVHHEMFSHKNESNMFYTWFRLLGLSYATNYSENKKLKYEWNLLQNKIGHQFKSW